MNKKWLIVVAILISLFLQSSQAIVLEANRVEGITLFSQWRINHKRKYHSIEELLYRQVVFLENYKKIKEHNSNPKNRYTISLNQFSDLTNDEFQYKHLMKKESITHQTHNAIKQNLHTLQSSNLLPSVDWRNDLTSIKNQGACGACWTFSAAALMEFQLNRQSGLTKTDLSEQQLVDCVNQENGYTCNGCFGGRAVQALDYATKFGVVNESEYPYEDKQGDCRFNNSTLSNGFKVKSYFQTEISVEGLKSALNETPVIISIDARNWSYYSSGIFDNCDPNDIRLTHSVLAVGYDENGNWIVRNQWGTQWGEEGYIRIAAGDTCGITQDGFYISQ